MELMKYLKTYKLFEEFLVESLSYSIYDIMISNLNNMKFYIDQSHDLKECSFEYYDTDSRMKYNIRFMSHGVEYQEFKPDIDDNYIIRFTRSKMIELYESDEKERKVIDSLFYVIVDSCLNNLDTLIEGINNILDNVNESEEQRITRLSIKNINFMFKMYIKFRDEIETSYKYQKYLLDKGDLIRLSKIKKLNPKIEPMVTDVKKQTEWS